MGGAIIYILGRGRAPVYYTGRGQPISGSNFFFK
jgi:hypothetical protein